MSLETRSVIQSGGSLSISLKKQLSEIGLKRGDRVHVSIDGDKIIISKNDHSGEIVKPTLIGEEMWNNFLSVLVKKHGYRLSNESIRKYIEEAIAEWIKTKQSWWKQPIIPI